MAVEAVRASDYIWRNEMSRRIGTTPQSAERLARANGVRVLFIPGMKGPKYHAGDVDRLIRESITGVGIPESGSAAKATSSRKRA